MATVYPKGYTPPTNIDVTPPTVPTDDQLQQMSDLFLGMLAEPTDASTVASLVQSAFAICGVSITTDVATPAVIAQDKTNNPDMYTPAPVEPIDPSGGGAPVKVGISKKHK